MNITDQILNPVQQPSLSEQILNASEGPSITDQVLSADSDKSPIQDILYANESPTAEPLNSAMFQDKYLSLEDSQEATEMSKHLYGDNGPDIYTQEDLDEANEYESERMLEENDIKAINLNIHDIVTKGIEEAAIGRSASISAWDRFLAAKFNYDGGLRASDLRQHQAEAEANNDFTDVPVSSMQLYQNKIDIIHRIRKELMDKIYAVIQLFTLLSLLILKHYNGERGQWKGMKWFFYIYYPAHLFVIGLIRVMLGNGSIFP